MFLSRKFLDLPCSSCLWLVAVIGCVGKGSLSQASRLYFCLALVASVLFLAIGSCNTQPAVLLIQPIVSCSFHGKHTNLFSVHVPPAGLLLLLSGFFLLWSCSSNIAELGRVDRSGVHRVGCCCSNPLPLPINVGSCRA